MANTYSIENKLCFPHSHTSAHTKHTPFPNPCPPVWALRGSLSFLTATLTQGLLYQGGRRGTAEMERKKIPRSQGKHQQLGCVCVCMYTAAERHGLLVLKPGCVVLKRPFLRNTDGEQTKQWSIRQISPPLGMKFQRCGSVREQRPRAAGTAGSNSNPEWHKWEGKGNKKTGKRVKEREWNQMKRAVSEKCVTGGNEKKLEEKNLCFLIVDAKPQRDPVIFITWMNTSREINSLTIWSNWLVSNSRSSVRNMMSLTFCYTFRVLQISR